MVHGTVGAGLRPCVLSWDPELAGDLDESRARNAVRASVAAGRQLPVGPWSPAGLEAGVQGGYGLLVLDGMAVRTVACEGRTAAELLGPGDLLNPSQCGRDHETIDVQTSWAVLAPMRLALLDRAFAIRMAAYPEVGVALAARGAQRARDLAIRLSIAQFSRVDDRLTLLLWHLAERWGRVVGDGVLVALPLTHDVLAQLIAVRRPSVTVGLGELRRRREILPAAGGWLLRGEPAVGLGRASVRALAG